MAARPPRPSGRRGRIDGKGYRRELYEEAIGKVLERVSLDAETLTRVVRLVSGRIDGTGSD